MRPSTIALFIAFALFFGCTVQGTANSAQNDSGKTTVPNPPAEQGANITAPPSVPPAPTEASANISAPPTLPHTPTTNETGPADSANGTANPAPEQDGLSFGNGSYFIALDDVSLVPTSQEPCGIFSLHSSEGELLDKLFICPGQSETWEGPDGASFRILVVKVAGGYAGTKWAQVIVYG